MANLTTFQKSEVMGEIVYISGSISADPNFKQKFSEWEKVISDAGAKVILNPTIHPSGMSYDYYMEGCLVMVRHSTVVFMLPDWASSPGALAEKAYAMSLKKKIVFSH